MSWGWGIGCVRKQQPCLQSEVLRFSFAFESHLPGLTRVHSTLGPKAVCTECGQRALDSKPNALTPSTEAVASSCEAAGHWQGALQAVAMASKRFQHPEAKPKPCALRSREAHVQPSDAICYLYDDAQCKVRWRCRLAIKGAHGETE